MKVLDLACGTGVVSYLLLKKFPKIKITAVDLSEEMLKYYRKNFNSYIKKGQIEVIQGNIEKLDKILKNRKNYYDVAFIASAIYNVRTKPTILAIHKILRKGGYVIFNISSLSLGIKDGFTYLLERTFIKKLVNIKVSKYRRINMKHLNNIVKRKFEIKTKPYLFILSKENVKEFFRILVYRDPFIFFRKSNIPYKKAFSICKKIFNEILKENKSFYESGYVFILKKKG